MKDLVLDAPLPWEMWRFLALRLKPGYTSILASLVWLLAPALQTQCLVRPTEAVPSVDVGWLTVACHCSCGDSVDTYTHVHMPTHLDAQN